MVSIYIQLNNGQYHKCDSLEQAKRFVKVGSGKYVKGTSRKEITLDFKKELWVNQNGICPLCSSEMSIYESLDVDHIHPYSQALFYKNGVENINEIANYQLTHASCNRKKHDKVFLEASQ